MECVTKGHKKPKKNQKKRKYINLNNALTLYVNVLKWREASSQNKIVNNPRSDKKKYLYFTSFKHGVHLHCHRFVEVWLQQK